VEIYRVHFPFEVDREHGTSDVYVSSLRSAFHEARRASAYSDEYGRGGDVVIFRAKTVPRSKEIVMRLLNNCGGWLESEEEVARIPSPQVRGVAGRSRRVE